MGGIRLLAEMLASPAPSAPLAPPAPSLSAGTPCANATVATTSLALSASDAAAKTSQDQQIALLAFIVLIALFTFLGAFIYMMIQKDAPATPAGEAADTSAASIGGSVRGLQNFLFPRSAAPVGLDPRLIKCLPISVYDSKEGSLRKRMPYPLPPVKDGVAVGVPVDPSAVPLTSREAGTGAGATDAREVSRKTGSIEVMLTPVASQEQLQLPAGNEELAAGNEQVQSESGPSSSSSVVDKECLAGLTDSIRRDGCSARECPVCLAEYKDGDPIKWLPDCNHAFHATCIDLWLRSHSTCPLCRVPVGPALVRLARPAE